MWKWILIVVVIIVVAAAVYASTTASQLVDTAPARRGRVTAFVEERATTRLPRTYRITMPIDGRILPIGLESGDPVRVGQIVAEIREKKSSFGAVADELERVEESLQAGVGREEVLIRDLGALREQEEERKTLLLDALGRRSHAQNEKVTLEARLERTQLLGRQALRAEDVPPPTDCVAQSLCRPVLEEEVADDHQYASALASGGDRAHRVVETGTACAAAIEDPLPHVASAPLSAQRREALDAAGVKGEERHAIVAGEGDVPKRHGQSPREVELAWIAVLHRRASVDGDPECKFFLLEEDLDEESIEPGVDVPVHEAQVVAGT